ncbi:AAA family ATPase [Lactonifactor longoviformis]|uniref:Uncharacterized AAA domain-containing protein ycf46 n=1 Tax=Lactonifactor longoviformis DSM 17459 TaxID=1122155 RepID=A0A1M5B148_9CLOT|nr:ATP-binding protein [Lactonifactor longoviformis]SHF36234.1 AAA+-type ATPase, SpoVK/Ycf46/Vps4 family [Lactonifactor longoviformis DSM 17459]
MKSLADLAMRVMDLYESGVAAFLFPTNYGEDLNRLTDCISCEMGYLPKNNIWEIGRIRNREGGYADDIYRYMGGAAPLEYPAGRVCAYTSVDLLRKTCASSPDYIAQALEAFFAVEDEEHSILIVRNAEEYIKRGSSFARALEKILCSSAGKQKNKKMLFLASGSAIQLPPMLEPYIYVEEIPGLTEAEIGNIIWEILGDKTAGDDKLYKKMIQYFKGFRTSEIKRILQYALLQPDAFGASGKALFRIINEEKKQLLIKSNSLLEWAEEREEQVGGLEAIKKWLSRKAAIYQNFDIMIEDQAELPKGVLIAGIPGTGKSLLARVTQQIFGIPLLKMSMGRLLGSYLGESEANLERALRLLKEMAPCVLWIDELEKAFAGTGSQEGHEVTLRLFGIFLSWMQEKDFPCFIVATANQLTGLRPEFFRKGRFDEKFYTFMPSQRECLDIFRVCLKRRTKNLEEDFSAVSEDELKKLLLPVLLYAAERKKFMTGAEIQALVTAAFESLILEYLEEEASLIRQNGRKKVSVRFPLTRVAESLRESLDETRMNAESKLYEISGIWLEMRKYDFLPAAGEKAEILPFDSLGEDGRFRPLTPLEEIYDQRLREEVIKGVEYLIAQEKKNNSNLPL